MGIFEQRNKGYQHGACFYMASCNTLSFFIAGIISGVMFCYTGNNVPYVRVEWSRRFRNAPARPARGEGIEFGDNEVSRDSVVCNRYCNNRENSILFM